VTREPSPEHVEARLPLFLSGELPDSARREVEAHLVRCLECREAHRELSGIIAHLASMEPPPVAWDAYGAQVRRRVEVGGAPRTSSWRAPTAAALAAGLVAALLYAAAGRPAPRSPDAASLDNLALASRLDLISRFRLVERLDMLEDYDVIDRLDRDPLRGEG
jgi:anti-sigma factor RsiW